MSNWFSVKNRLVIVVALVFTVVEPALAVNRAPVLTYIGNRIVNEYQTISFVVSATDPDNDPLTFSATSLPSGATFDPATRVFSWTPSGTQAGGTYNPRFTVSDGLLTDSEVVNIRVNDFNSAPAVSPIEDKVINEGEVLNFVVSATDLDGDNLQYALYNFPTGMRFITAERRIYWELSFFSAGVYPGIRLQVSDGKTTVNEEFTLTVNNINRAPAFFNPEAINDQTLTEGESMIRHISGFDPDHSPTAPVPLTYSIVNAPSGSTWLYESHWKFRWTPTVGQAGIYKVRFDLSDGIATTSKEITITVLSKNPPTPTPTPPSTPTPAPTIAPTPTPGPTNAPTPGSNPVAQADEKLNQLRANLAVAFGALKPNTALGKREAITLARQTIADLIAKLQTLLASHANEINATYPKLTPKNLVKLGKLLKQVSRNSVTPSKARKLKKRAMKLARQIAKTG